jgi:hypothetical protein
MIEPHDIDVATAEILTLVIAAALAGAVTGVIGASIFFMW